MQTIFQTHLLLNPVAGNGQALKSFAKLKQVLIHKHIPYKYQVSHRPGELIALAKEYGNLSHTANDILIVIGGDGSLNEVLNGIKNSNNPDLPITYLPAGSGNDFARAAHLTSSPEVLINQLLKSVTYQTVDCGMFISPIKNNKPYYFVNNFGIGFDAFVVHESNHQKMKKGLNKLHLGNLIYGFNILNVLRRQDTFSVTVKRNGEQQHFDQVYFVTTTNHPYFGGGIAILPSATINNHHLDTVVVQKPNLRKFFKLFAKLLKDGSHVIDPHFHDLAGTEIIVKTTKREYAQIDGEDQRRQSYQIKFKIDHFNLRK